MSTQEVFYHNPKTLMIIGKDGRMRLLTAPFRVQCLVDYDNIPRNTRLYVDKVMLHSKYRIVYQINRRLFPYHCFKIDVIC